MLRLLFFCFATCQTILRIGESHVKTRTVKLMFDSSQVIQVLLTATARQLSSVQQCPGGYYVLNPKVRAIAARPNAGDAFVAFVESAASHRIPWPPIAKATARQTFGVSVGLAIMWTQCLGPTCAPRSSRKMLTKPW